MTRASYVLRDGKLVEKHKAAPLSGKGGVQIIHDIEPFKSPETGEVIRSRSHLRTHLRDHGLVDRGNEHMRRREYRPGPIGPDIKAAMQKLGR